MAGGRPFLKWAGGKRQLLPDLLAQVRRLSGFGTYHEPFVGGGALFFELRAQGLLENGAVLADVNARLIETYQGVADDVEQVIDRLRVHATNHSADHFYAVRKTVPATLVDRAARIIYLNRTCFNGLFRENRRGEFNVPLGRYKNPVICNEPTLRAAAAALNGVRLAAEPFERVLAAARASDLVYFDPPYVPLSKTASFTAYAQAGFALDDQVRLAAVFAALAERGVFVMLSNSKTDIVERLYARFHRQTVQAGRAVNSKADRRGKVEELIVTNF